MDAAFDAIIRWSALDTWIVVTAAMMGMACALPGCYLLLRRQSLMGDAISHTALPGIALAFLAAQWAMQAGWLDANTYTATRHLIMLTGAVLIGVLAAVLTEVLQKLGQVEASAALGIVFTALFALGLLLIRLVADSVDLDPDCVLYGTLETAVMDTLPGTGIPRAALVGTAMLAVNGLLVLIFYKELKISAFDPALATSLGIDARWMHYGLMAVTGVTVVAAFESVGSIVVIGMLIAPPATAFLLTQRLGSMLAASLLVAALAAVTGHFTALLLPTLLSRWLPFPHLAGEAASTAGSMGLALGVLFALALCLSPRNGLLIAAVRQWRLSLRVATEDALGWLYRAQERAAQKGAAAAAAFPKRLPGFGPLMSRLAVWRLQHSGLVAVTEQGWQLTDAGRLAAEQVIRGHRLFESYMARHFVVPSDHLHETAERVEHYLDAGLRRELAAELDRPKHDPHGREIPPESNG